MSQFQRGNKVIGPLDLSRIVPTQMLFQTSSEEEEVFHQSDLVQLKAYGISISHDPQNPFLLLRDAKQELTLPVAINPLEAGVTLSQSPGSKNNSSSPFRFIEELLKSLNVNLRQCVFVQMKGSVQYVRIYFTGHIQLNSIKLRADEAMSLCLSLNVPIFATKDFIHKSRLMNAQMEGLSENLLKTQKRLLKNHPYLM